MATRYFAKDEDQIWNNRTSTVDFQTRYEIEDAWETTWKRDQTIASIRNVPLVTRTIALEAAWTLRKKWGV